MSDFNPKNFTKKLEEILKEIPDGVYTGDASIKKSGKEERRIISEAIEELTKLYQILDPIRQPEHVFDPSDPKKIGELIAKTLLIQPFHGFAGLEKFYGSGVYALYYNGDFEAYRPISGKRHPIYIGKADPAVHDAVTVEEQGVKLHGRLLDHRRTLEKAENLSIEDFSVQYLVVKSAWQKPAEDYLIDLFKPVWNKEMKVCFGFGKHGDSSSTRKNKRSPWDTIHPGRMWAATKETEPNEKSENRIIEEIAKHFATNPPIDPLNIVPGVMEDQHN